MQPQLQSSNRTHQECHSGSQKIEKQSIVGLLTFVQRASTHSDAPFTSRMFCAPLPRAEARVDTPLVAEEAAPFAGAQITLIDFRFRSNSNVASLRVLSCRYSSQEFELGTLNLCD